MATFMKNATLHHVVSSAIEAEIGGYVKSIVMKSLEYVEDDVVYLM